MHGQNWNQYMYDLQQLIQKQDHRIKALEEQIKQLQTNEKDRGKVIIEKVEYKFDQLKVETLSGSLHIGLTPEELNQIEDVALGQTKHPESYHPSISPFDQQLTAELNQWLQQSGPSMIEDLSKTRHLSVDDSHKSLLLQDIQKQFPSRISFYREQANNANENRSEIELKEYIKKQIMEEVHYSLSNYMKNKGEINNDDGGS